MNIKDLNIINELDLMDSHAVYTQEPENILFQTHTDHLQKQHITGHDANINKIF